MERTTIETLRDYLDVLPSQLTLFRGQPVRWNLLPKLARDDRQVDTGPREREMLAELRRRGAMLIERGLDDWDLLVLAQHFGMKTRLLDWTSNPLAALWFGCADRNAKKPCHVYGLSPGEDDWLDKAAYPSPFDAKRTRVLKPTLNSARIIAQQGFFTAHMFSARGGWVSLNRNKRLATKLIEIQVPGERKAGLLRDLDRLGVNDFSLFPDVEGLCRQINALP